MYKIIIAIIVTLFAISNGYPQPPQPYSQQPENTEYSSPTPYSFGYNTDDGQGNTQARQESGDASGAVTGSYSYRDAYGVYRTVEYIADANGFRARIKTNEPGTETSAPADVVITSNQSPVTAPVVAPRVAPIPTAAPLPLWSGEWK